MNKYAREPEQIIDLHGRTIREAERALDTLFAKGFAHVRIIVGKGLHSKQGPKLRDAVKAYLHAREVHFTQSKINDGGEGALEVYI